MDNVPASRQLERIYLHVIQRALQISGRSAQGPSVQGVVSMPFKQYIPTLGLQHGGGRRLSHCREIHVVVAVD